MGIDVFQAEHRVFLKTNAHDSELGNFVDTIPLKTNTITVNAVSYTHLRAHETREMAY